MEPKRLNITTTEKIRTPEPCYHCNQKGLRNSYCHVWTIWVCPDCTPKCHKSYHPSCEKPTLTKDDIQEYQRSKYFNLSFRRMDGSMSDIRLKRGDRIEMEDHWLGTYVVVPGGMMLVRHTREEINQMILKGLASAK